MNTTLWLDCAEEVKYCPDASEVLRWMNLAFFWSRTCPFSEEVATSQYWVDTKLARSTRCQLPINFHPSTFFCFSIITTLSDRAILQFWIPFEYCITDLGKVSPVGQERDQFVFSAHLLLSTWHQHQQKVSRCIKRTKKLYVFMANYYMRQRCWRWENRIRKTNRVHTNTEYITKDGRTRKFLLVKWVTRASLSLRQVLVPNNSLLLLGCRNSCLKLLAHHELTVSNWSTSKIFLPLCRMPLKKFTDDCSNKLGRLGTARSFAKTHRR